ncbi:MAG: hypothetical protein M1160_02485 [Candidatus Marsarchaeota archaeon]|nr:hypothetical protein [Candidatus Marsarchaeota archaeon]MCL5111723.1 hypothetical protein [Candidatus Marsarchaeota archaeon]
MNRNITLIILEALFGIGAVVSAYLIYVHYVPSALICPNTGIISCVTVLTSVYSVIFGIPLAAYAVVWFVVALLFTRYGKFKLAADIWMLIGIGGIIYSVFAMHMIGKICIFCSALDVIIAVSLALFFMRKP